MSNISLYDISSEFKGLYNLSSEVLYDEETGELIDSSKELTSLFNEIEATLENKLDATNYIIKELKANEEALKVETKRLAAKANAMKSKAEYLKGLMLLALKSSEQGKVKTAKFTFSVRKSESVSIANEDLIGREWFRIKKEIDKTKLKKALKSGELVDGVSLDTNYSLSVR